MSDEITKLTADVVLLAPPQQVLLIQRGWDPYKGKWALPGGHVESGESTISAAYRELTEETDLVVDSLELVGVYAEPGRDPRGRYVTFAYYLVIDSAPPAPNAGDDAVDARWWPIDELTTQMMAFDHHSIITDALLMRDRQRQKRTV
jgi:8-oxo-dGTP diphosphatase